MLEFTLALDSEHPASDLELEVLLKQAYVDAGYTDAAVGEVAFRAANVRARGEVLLACDAAGALLGTITLVVTGSPACRFAGPEEAELHLLAVHPRYRRNAVGRALVAAAFIKARNSGAQRVFLWTQSAMLAAQALYEQHGFVRLPALDFEREGRAFLVYSQCT